MLLSPVFALLFPLFAQQGAPEAVPSPSSPTQPDVVVTAPEARPICRERGADVGSNIRRRQQVCITAEQAEAEAERGMQAQVDAVAGIAAAGMVARAAAGEYTPPTTAVGIPQAPAPRERRDEDDED